jgi:uncharacterized protein YihD (DUF1040 family)
MTRKERIEWFIAEYDCGNPRHKELVKLLREINHEPSFEDAVRCVKDKIEIEEKKISEYRKENDGVHPIIYEAYRNAFQLILTELKGMIK